MSEETTEKYEFSDEDLDNFMEKALAVVKDEAGEMIREGLGKSAAVNKDFNAGDGAAAEVLTEVDGAVEKLIVEKLQEAFPDHKFIGEEGIGAETEGKLPLSALTNNPTWIIDPIDGTMNFVHGNPLVVTSVGLAINKKLVLGIINAPCIDKCYSAIKGKGAFLNGEQKLSVSSVKKLKDAFVVCEISAGANQAKRETTSTNISNLMLTSHAVRCFGPAALDIAFVGAGQADAWFHAGIHCWDIAAGAVIVSEAGGVVMSPDGSEFDLMSRTCLAAASKELAVELSNTIKHYKIDAEYPEPVYAMKEEEDTDA